MDDKKMNTDNLIFGLDIGTRSIVGSVGYMAHGFFKVMAHYLKKPEFIPILHG